MYGQTMQPLLRAPGFGGKPPYISRGVTPWGASRPGPQTSIGARIIAARVGGEFWRKPAELPRGAFHTVLLPPGLTAAKALFARAAAASPVQGLLVLFPQFGAGFAGLAETVRRAGAAIALAGEPHAVLDISRAITLAAMDDLGILGLLAGRPVFTGGLHRQAPEHAIAWVTEGTAYFDPFTGAPSTCDATIELLADWRRVLLRNRSIAVCTGMSLWKRGRISQLLTQSEAAPPFRRSAGAALRVAKASGGAIAVWSTRTPRGLAARAAQQNIPLIRVEDGFIRSAGLGSDLLPPASIIADRRGIYFDPSRESDLEHLLAHGEFPAGLQARARRLIDLLIARGISKYAAGGAAPRLQARPGQRIILIPGQVEDDLSIRLGTPGIRTNAELLREVRHNNPDAYLVYRPHPDVEAGHRVGAIAATLADQIVTGGAMAALLGAVDEVHTLTSLAGFEALLRAKRVETYGQPFYAGWGLTTDHAPLPRRQRRLKLEELAAAALILYPLYVDPATGLPCGPELLISRLEQAELWRPSALMRLRRLQGRIRRAFRHITQNRPSAHA